jgi:hypothetical protein
MKTVGYAISRFSLLLACSLLLPLAGVGIPLDAQAQTEATINVTAAINEPAFVSIRLCDTTADFGNDLNSTGNLSGVGEDISASTPGENPGEGV